MVLDTAKLKNRKSTILPGMRGRDAAKELTLKVNISAWNAWKRCCKNVDIQGGHFTGIHDRFLRDRVYRESQLLVGWTEHKCKEMDELAQHNHTYHLSTEEFQRYQGQWYLTLNKSGKNGDPIFELQSLSKIVYTTSQ